MRKSGLAGTRWRVESGVVPKNEGICSQSRRGGRDQRIAGCSNKQVILLALVKPARQVLRRGATSGGSHLTKHQRYPAEATRGGVSTPGS